MVKVSSKGDICQSPSSGVVAVILAAGFSKRFGADKRLHPIETPSTENKTENNTQNSTKNTDCKPLLQTTLESIVPHFNKVLLVHRYLDDNISALLEDYPVIKIAAPEHPIGLGVSLATAAKHLLNETSQSKHIMVFLADMPNIKSHTICTLLAEIENNAQAAIRPQYLGQAGHPVCIPASLLESLSELNQDEGAAKLIKQSGTRLRLVDVDDAGVLFDIDTPEQGKSRQT
ncbi:nucleotidyltransferase family protein [Thalassotalea litorea]|uniref:Nucleotidyltransferase family protein n=1 Tax=Thalassotalea litorea TaxID=2020715 RepID=A0A5R9IMH3_9GAMM|nr:nucleotidyltransferase family protein [Thalassotalea litorea]TLU61189.1 nucleotidyltransferase family protein [Thalassotalea litorea]